MSRKQFVLTRQRHAAHMTAVSVVKAQLDREIAQCMRDDHRLTAEAVLDALKLLVEEFGK